MAREYPQRPADMTGIFGMGERKLAELAPAFADEIGAYLQDNARMTFND